MATRSNGRVPDCLSFGAKMRTPLVSCCSSLHPGHSVRGIHEIWKWKTSQRQTIARGSGGNLRFDPEGAALAEGEMPLLAFGSALEDFAFELERACFSCTDNERVDGIMPPTSRTSLGSSSFTPGSALR